MTDIRLTREAVEVVSNLTTTPEVRVTREAVEVVTNLTTTPVVRVTRQAIEVLASLESGPPTPAGGNVRRVISINYLFI